MSWDNYFMGIATSVSARSTCDRLHVGAVIVSRDKHILCTGYNGSIAGLDHCDNVGHLIEDDHCVRVIHAEINAVAHAAYNGVSLRKSTCYVTAMPCWNCFKALINSGISIIKYRGIYKPDNKTTDALWKLHDIKMVQI